MNAYTRFVTFNARPGSAGELVERLLLAAALVAEAPGCEQWHVHRDEAELDVVRVSEIWASRARSDAALQLDGMPESAASVTELLNSPPEVLGGELIGGARLARGSAGASRFAILDAPDLSQPDGLEVLVFGTHSPGDGEMVSHR